MKNNNFFIRKACLSDLDLILNIENDSFIDGIRELPSVIQERIETFSDGFLLICNDSGPVGYISSEIWNYKEDINESDFLLGHSIKDMHNRNGDELYISSIGILKNMRGNKLASTLFNTLLDTIKENFPNVKSSILMVSSEWENAQKIYLKSGFKEIGIAKDFFQSSDGTFCDGIIMRKKGLD